MKIVAYISCSAVTRTLLGAIPKLFHCRMHFTWTKTLKMHKRLTVKIVLNAFVKLPSFPDLSFDFV